MKKTTEPNFYYTETDDNIVVHRGIAYKRGYKLLSSCAIVSLVVAVIVLWLDCELSSKLVAIGVAAYLAITWIATFILSERNYIIDKKGGEIYYKNLFRTKYINSLNNLTDAKTSTQEIRSRRSLSYKITCVIAYYEMAPNGFDSLRKEITIIKYSENWNNIKHLRDIDYLQKRLNQLIKNK